MRLIMVLGMIALLSTGCTKEITPNHTEVTFKDTTVEAKFINKSMTDEQAINRVFEILDTSDEIKQRMRNYNGKD